MWQFITAIAACLVLVFGAGCSRGSPVHDSRARQLATEWLRTGSDDTEREILQLGVVVLPDLATMIEAVAPSDAGRLCSVALRSVGLSRYLDGIGRSPELQRRDEQAIHSGTVRLLRSDSAGPQLCGCILAREAQKLDPDLATELSRLVGSKNPRLRHFAGAPFVVVSSSAPRPARQLVEAIGENPALSQALTPTLVRVESMSAWALVAECALEGSHPREWERKSYLGPPSGKFGLRKPDTGELVNLLGETQPPSDSKEMTCADVDLLAELADTPFLVELLNGEKPALKAAAGSIFARRKAEPPQSAMGRLVRLLDDSDMTVATYAAAALSSLDPLPTALGRLRAAVQQKRSLPLAYAAFNVLDEWGKIPRSTSSAVKQSRNLTFSQLQSALPASLRD